MPMTLCGACIIRRPLSNTSSSSLARLWHPNTPKRSLPTTLSQRHHSTIYSSKPRQRPVEKNAHEDVIETLLYVLRPRLGRHIGLENRQDGYVSIKRILNYPEFRRLDMPTLQQIVDRDLKHRFDIHYDPTKADDHWWLRAKRWNEIHRFLKPIGPDDVPEHVVYTTTLEEWDQYTSRIGLPSLHNSDIRLECGVPAPNYIADLTDHNQVFIFVDIPKCIQSGMHFFTPLPTAQPKAAASHLLTKGDEWGFIPPTFFSKVDFVQAKKTLLWGNPDPTPHIPWPKQNFDFDVKGERKTFVRPLPRNLHGFVDFVPSQNNESTQVHPDTMKEAELVSLRGVKKRNRERA